MLTTVNQTLDKCPGMEYSYSYLYSYLLEYFFSVLSCTLYLAKFMSTCTRTYLSTVTKKNLYSWVLYEYFLNFNQIGKKKLIISQAFLHLFQMPLICFFSDLKKSGLLYFFRCHNQKIVIFMLKMNKKGAPLCYDQIKNKKVASSVFLRNKKYK